MTKTLILSATLLAATTIAATTIAAAAGDNAVQGRPMGGLAMSMQDEQAMEAASMARGKPAPMHKHMMMRRHMMKHAM